MNILIVANHYAVASGRYAADAFKRLGHDVRTDGPAQGRNIWGLQVRPEQVWHKQAPLFGWKPDFVLVMDSDPALLDAEHYDCPVYVWGVDNHVRDYRRDHISHYFLAHRTNSVMPWQDDMTHLPCAYDPALHVPSPIPYAEREYDVCMIGVMYPQRWATVEALKAAGVKVLAGTGLVHQDYVDAYHNSRIALDLSFNGDVNQRVFEAAAMGNVVMSDRRNDYVMLMPDGFWIFDKWWEDERTPAEIAEIIVDDVQRVLSNPAKAQEQIKQSLAWVQPHTWDLRAQVIVGWHQERGDG